MEGRRRKGGRIRRTGRGGKSREGEIALH